MKLYYCESYIFAKIFVIGHSRELHLLKFTSRKFLLVEISPLRLYYQCMDHFSRAFRIITEIFILECLYWDIEIINFGTGDYKRGRGDGWKNSNIDKRRETFFVYLALKSTLYIMKYSSKMNISEIKNTPPFLRQISFIHQFN